MARLFCVMTSGCPFPPQIWNCNATTGVVGVFNLQGASWDRSRRRFHIHSATLPELSSEWATLPPVTALPTKAVARRWQPQSLLHFCIFHCAACSFERAEQARCSREADLSHCRAPLALQLLCGPPTSSSSGSSWRAWAAMWRAHWRQQRSRQTARGLGGAAPRPLAQQRRASSSRAALRCHVAAAAACRQGAPAPPRPQAGCQRGRAS